MGDMIRVVDYISGHIYESKKLAGESLNIPVRIINKSLHTNTEVIYNNRKYKFGYNFNKKCSSFRSSKFPFGKYKGQSIKECTDKDYIIWLIKQAFTDIGLRTSLKERLKELNNG
mgnify:CR=1 FL=1|jgi:uncharacterized protein (DUF3820 family)